jgi:hypothetical protein
MTLDNFYEHLYNFFDGIKNNNDDDFNYLWGYNYDIYDKLCEYLRLYYLLLIVYTLKLSPHPHAPLEFGFVNVNSDDNSVSVKSIWVLKLSIIVRCFSGELQKMIE